MVASLLGNISAAPTGQPLTWKMRIRFIPIRKEGQLCASQVCPRAVITLQPTLVHLDIQQNITVVYRAMTPG